jgi:4-hydroxybenzoate polyprenyltransferase
VFVSVAGFGLVSFLTRIEVLLTLAPFALITLFYSVPVFKSRKKRFFRLREISYLKIFLIAMVWSATTILLPIVQSNQTFENIQVACVLAERFLFILAITVPFDIRDMEADRNEGTITIPIKIGTKKAMILCYSALTASFLISFFHYLELNQGSIIWALGISALSTLLFLGSKKIGNLQWYHYGILDGTMLLQGILVVMFYYFTGN